MKDKGGKTNEAVRPKLAEALILRADYQASRTVTTNVLICRDSEGEIKVVKISVA